MKQPLLAGCDNASTRPATKSSSDPRSADRGADGSKASPTPHDCRRFAITPLDAHWTSLGAVRSSGVSRSSPTLGSHALFGDGLELAGRIAEKTGVDLLAETTPARLARGEGRVPIEKIPYLPEDAIPFLQKYEQLILVGALFPVTTFAYKGKPVIKVPASCQVTAMATVDHDIWLALGDLAKAVGAASQPTVRQARSKGAPPAGVLTDAAVGQSIGLLLPENAILVSDCATSEPAPFSGTEGARAHDYLLADCGGAIGAGLPVGLGAAVACPGRRRQRHVYAADALEHGARESRCHYSRAEERQLRDFEYRVGTGSRRRPQRAAVRDRARRKLAKRPCHSASKRAGA